MKKISWIILNVFLSIGILVDVLVMSLYDSVFKSSSNGISDISSSLLMICLMSGFFIIIALVSLVFINIPNNKVIELVGFYIALTYGILIIISFFLFMFFGFINILLGIVLIVFAVFSIKTINN